MRDSQIFTIY